LEGCGSAASFLQSCFWGKFKERFGWKPFGFLVEWENEVTPLLVLCRRLAPGFVFAYVPWGPQLPDGFSRDDTERTETLASLASGLRSFLPRTAAFIRFDPPWFSKEAKEKDGTRDPSQIPALGAPFRRAGADIQPPDTVIVDLSPPMEEIFAGMKAKWRYNARLAVKKGLVIRDCGIEDLGVFYNLLTETAERDGIAIHGMEYYTALFETCRDRGVIIKLYLAEHEGDVLAGIVVLRRKDQAVYLYGASSNVKRNFMAPYALQVKAMEDAKASGCTSYDLFGIPPDDDPSHPMHGLYQFKTGTGGHIIHRPGSWDYAYKPLVCAAFRAAESLRKTLRTFRKREARSRK
jgi:lipid II:glycine glycyltransferase (peptidoglycan interpeptide bridge formation enzyme)